MSADKGNASGQSKAFFKGLEHLESGSELPLDELLGSLGFNEQGLIPAIAQDAESNEVLMFAWMDRAALERTLSTGQMTYFSRSRNQLWIKGETSGHYQAVVDVRMDCDGDVLLFRIQQEGAACHTGRRSCFYLDVDREKGMVTVRGSATK